MRRMPIVKTFAGSLLDATAKVDLTGSYAKVGNAACIHGLDAMTMILHEHANVENVVVKFFVAPDGSQPTSSSGMYQVVNADGTEIEVTVVKNTYLAYSAGIAMLSGKWFLLEGKGASGTSGDLSAFLFCQEILDKRKSMIPTTNLTILSTPTQLTTSYADVGSFVDIAGLSNLTLYLRSTESDTDPADVTVYIEKSTTKPTATTTMHRIGGTNGTATAFRVLTGEYAAHQLGNVSGRWLGIQAKSTGTGTAATITAYLTGVAQGV